MRVVVALVWLAAFAGVLYGLIRSVQYKRQEQLRRPEDTRAQFRVLARLTRFLAVIATLFPVLLIVQGFVWQPVCFFGLAVLCWLLHWYVQRRSRT